MHKVETELVNIEAPNEHHASSAPLYLSATFHHPNMTDPQDYDYAPKGNPTRTALEQHLAKIMGNAERVFATHTGMNALEVLSRLLVNGDEVIAGSALYAGSSRLLALLRAQQGIHTHYVDTSKVDEITSKLNEKTRFVFLESPTNPVFRICDIPTVCRAIKSTPFGERTIIIVDNTMMSPINANPFELGADIWFESGTKFLSGHHDMMAGIIAVKDPELAKKVHFMVYECGAGLDPFHCWMLLRGLKTLSVRFEKQQQNASEVGKFLKAIGPQLKVPKFELFWAGDPDMPGYDVHARMTRGPGSVLVFRTHDSAISQRIVESATLYKISVSFGTVNSLISMPCIMSHRHIGDNIYAEGEFPQDIVRVSVGIENAEDLVEDLKTAFVKAGVL